MTTPPREYFEICSSNCAGAQRIGFDWYRFTDPDALSRMIADGTIGDPCREEIEQLEEKIRSAISALE